MFGQRLDLARLHLQLHGLLAKQNRLLANHHKQLLTRQQLHPRHTAMITRSRHRSVPTRRGRPQQPQQSHLNGYLETALVTAPVKASG